MSIRLPWILGAIIAILAVTLSMWATYEFNIYAYDPGYVTLVPYDALYYRSLAIEYADSPFWLVRNTTFLHFLRLNWIGLPTLGGLLYSVTGPYFDIVVTLINVLLFTSFLFDMSFLVRHFGAPRYTKEFLVVVTCSLLFILPYMIGLSKEMISMWIIARYMVVLIKRRYVSFLALCILAFIVRQQYAVIGILFVLFSRMKIRPAFVLIGSALLYPLMPESFYGLQPDFLDRGGISSAELMVSLHRVASVPGGYLLVLPVRLALNLAQPVWPENILRSVLALGNGRYEAAWSLLLYHLSGLAAIACVVWASHAVWVRKKAISHDIASLIWAYVLVLGAVAYLHPRYFFPLVPIVILAAYTARKKSTVEGPLSENPQPAAGGVARG
jgi:hypothetical protein